jgi:hypothetical protein
MRASGSIAKILALPNFCKFSYRGSDIENASRYESAPSN